MSELLLSVNLMHCHFTSGYGLLTPEYVNILSWFYPLACITYFLTIVPICERVNKG